MLGFRGAGIEGVWSLGILGLRNAGVQGCRGQRMLELRDAWTRLPELRDAGIRDAGAQRC